LAVTNALRPPDGEARWRVIAIGRTAMMPSIRGLGEQFIWDEPWTRRRDRRFALTRRRQLREPRD
jgi:hypothetical protein